MSINAIFKPGQSNFKEKRYRKKVNDMQMRKTAVFKWPTILEKKKNEGKGEKKKRKKRKIEMNQHQGRKWVGIDGLDVGGGKGRGGERDNSERMKCKSGNKGNVAEN